MNTPLRQPMGLLDAWENTPEPPAPLSERAHLESQLRTLCAEQGLASSDQRIQAAVAAFMGVPDQTAPPAVLPPNLANLANLGGQVRTDHLTSVTIAPLTTPNWLRPENRAAWEAAQHDLALWKKKRWSIRKSLGVGCGATALVVGWLYHHVLGDPSWLHGAIVTAFLAPLVSFLCYTETQSPHFERVATRFPWLRDPAEPRVPVSLEEVIHRLTPATPTSEQVTRWRSHPVTAGWYNLLQQTEVPLLNEDVRHLDAYLTPPEPRRNGTQSIGAH